MKFVDRSIYLVLLGFLVPVFSSVRLFLTVDGFVIVMPLFLCLDAKNSFDRFL